MVSTPLICPICPNGFTKVIKYGFFTRRCRQKSRIQRYQCKSCHSTFSRQTGTLTYRERRPHLTHKVLKIVMEGVSQRGCARALRCDPRTVARKIRRLGRRAKELLLERSPSDVSQGQETEVIFDEMETFEHTKCKPVSIAIAVSSSTRQVIAVKAAQMPPKKKLSAVAQRRYGPRTDQRRETMTEVLREASRLCPNLISLKSDKCPRYPAKISRFLLISSSIRSIWAHPIAA